MSAESISYYDKCPASYEPYRTTLDEMQLAIAREELNEYDHTREPALAQMREFIAKHPQIKFCRTDPVFLLSFLRVRKFNVQASCEMLERWFICRTTCKEFFMVTDPLKLEPLRKQKIVVPLGPDAQGRLVITVRVGMYDPMKVQPEEINLLAALLLDTYQYVELYQVQGLVLIMDLEGVTLAHLGSWTLPKLKTSMGAINDSIKYRPREIHVINVPKYAVKLVDFCVKALKTKLRDRLQVSSRKTRY
ncbi:clavesin-2-like [Uranotaenia lowii]|uniref:clavesin-2-like n=1 Tax=Uranotaenia lowii TaxID=190385 RepID=UPI00247AE7DB|nr:clavesin-2-like [Uranotaenia lowii]